MNRYVVVALTLLALACTAEDAGPSEPAGEGKLVVTANWLDGTLSILDAEALVSGVADRAAVETASIDLSAHAPGPLEVEITPDGKLALVAVSAGFFSLPFAGIIVNEQSIPAGTGGLLFVDLESRQVVAEVATGDHPMGIRITQDGTRAMVAHFGSGNLAVVDIANRSVIADVPLGIYAEEVAFDDLDRVGVVSYSDDGSLRTFAVDDPAATLSPQVPLTGDSAGVAFFPGTTIAFALQTANGITNQESGYTLLDVNNPSAPMVLSDVRWPESTMGYGVAVHRARGTVIVPLVIGGRLVLREYGLDGDDVTLEHTVDVTSAMLMGARAVAVDGQGRVWCAVPRERVLTVTDLVSGESVVVPWGTRASPTDVAIW